MNPSILFFDFDGTLRIEERDEISAKTYESFDRLKAQGHLVFLNTGRSYFALGEQVFTLPFDGMICGCGTYIRYHDTILLEAALPQESIQQVVHALTEKGIEAILEGHHGLYCNKITSDYMREQVVSIEKRGLQFLPVTDPSFHFVKMSLHYPNDSIRKQFEQEMAGMFDFIPRNEAETEAVLKGYSKGNAMLTLLSTFHLAKTQSFAFGDSNNDEEMLLAAGTSILIGNKASHLIDQVDYVAADAAHDGVTEALYHYHLLNKEE